VQINVRAEKKLREETLLAAKPIQGLAQYWRELFCSITPSAKSY